jgi:primosomal protein N'
MADFVTLSCPSCGGKLEVTHDIDCFACAHCGREHMVKRTGGTVSLSPVVDAMRKVEVGVDKTAAELAIVRLQKEIENIQAHKQILLANSPRPQVGAIPVFLILIGTFLAILGLVTYNLTDTSVMCIEGGIIMVLIGLIPFLLRSSNTKRWEETIIVKLKSLDEQLAAKHAELLHYQKIVSL